ncbi:hypothetical protein [Paraburkholderia sp. BL25I1N1]|uniref:hypothetical protein n=1 Tax=Paraburkholderia sp. BL25I1N1 TaxID=1938804 RepID=UPI000D059F80|nr:hypothetical protein [Paraburkholderia sp. BL25I1N1]PRY01137.1 hypothetical protein B0G73_12097 [Paraburkholderia sp. BL25I1N1]
MSITTRAVQTYTGKEFGPVKAHGTLAPWQRCAIGSVNCVGEPRQAQMLCKAGVVYVNENEWASFSLIKPENMPGTIPLQSMNLCSSQ